jgi:hypothetical protein
VANLDYENEKTVVLNLANESVVPHAVSPQILELLTPQGLPDPARIIQVGQSSE